MSYRAWLIRNLKRAGFNKKDLVSCYQSLVRPVFDYTAVVYHSLLTKEQGKRLERLQKRILNIIDPGPKIYADKLTEYGITTLEERRAELVGRFVQKILVNENFSSKWFPKK